jgi:hypothetical protein
MGVVVAPAPLGETPAWLIRDMISCWVSFMAVILAICCEVMRALDLVHHGVDLLICGDVAGRELLQGLPERQQLLGLGRCYRQIGVLQFECANQQLGGG